ncbi:MAG: type II secretion system protein [Bacilli bacterium]|nr:type II secretion system protein [Bacilli bacterium]
MKNKKGFTLVEVLGVVAILALLATIATPAILATSNRIKKKMYDTKVKLIKENAILYAEKEGLTSGRYQVYKLCEYGYVTPDENVGYNGCLKNPYNDKDMGTACYFNVKKETNGRYTITFPESAASPDCKAQ